MCTSHSKSKSNFSITVPCLTFGWTKSGFWIKIQFENVDNRSFWIWKGIKCHTLTCADEHDIILPVLCLDPVHHDLFQLVRNVGLYEHRLTQGWIHRSPHQGVVAGKLQHRIREVFCAAKLSAWLVGDFTRALERRRGRGRERCGETKEKGRWVGKILGWLTYDAKLEGSKWIDAGTDSLTEARQKQEFKAKFWQFSTLTQRSHHFPPLEVCSPRRTVV